MGTTSVASVDQNGTSTTVFSLPDGTVATRVRLANAPNVTTTYIYSPQSAPIPAPRSTSAIYSSEPVETPYLIPSSPESGFQVLDSITLAPSVFGLISYGPGAYGTTSVDASGVLISRIYAADGSEYVQREFEDGSVEATRLTSSGGSDLTLTTDPFANESSIVASDPLLIANSVNVAFDQAREQELLTGELSYLNMSAANALTSSFPYTDLQGLEG